MKPNDARGSCLRPRGTGTVEIVIAAVYEIVEESCLPCCPAGGRGLRAEWLDCRIGHSCGR
jgi:hypothetical protein